jgi:hypothetical protein
MINSSSKEMFFPIIDHTGQKTGKDIAPNITFGKQASFPVCYVINYN